MRAAAFVAQPGYGADADVNDVFELARDLDHLKRVYRLDEDCTRDTKRSVPLSPQIQNPGTVNGRANHIVYLAFTSGTTGEPKGVMHTNNTLLANARALAQEWGFDASSVLYTLSPLSHNLGFGALVLAILVGAELVLHDLPRGIGLLQQLRDRKATFIFGVPAHAVDLLAEIEREGHANIESLKGFRISGAAVPQAVVEKLIAYGIKPQGGYGMTEAGSHHFTLPDDPPEVIVTTSGKACPGYEVRIFSVGDSNKPVETGEIGHIGGRGASLMLGYYNDQDATEKSFNAEGWFMTGDLGRLDDNGYLQITGRIKDIIIRGGHNIHPAKIELLAMRHPQVERAAAIPVKDDRLGEKVCIVVMPKQGKAVDPEILLLHLHEQGLSKYDMPEYFLEVEEIPLSAAGKILKRVLLPWIETGALVPKPVRFRG
jgi:acyl-CoA synthetase